MISILAINARQVNDGSITCESIALCLQDSALVISVDIDTDEILLGVIEGSSVSSLENQGWRAFAPLDEFLGRELGWCWSGTNYKGYSDTFTVSFGGIDPQIAFCGAASDLWIYRLNRI